MPTDFGDRAQGLSDEFQSAGSGEHKTREQLLLTGAALLTLAVIVGIPLLSSSEGRSKIGDFFGGLGGGIKQRLTSEEDQRKEKSTNDFVSLAQALRDGKLNDPRDWYNEDVLACTQDLTGMDVIDFSQWVKAHQTATDTEIKTEVEKRLQRQQVKSQSLQECVKVKQTQNPKPVSTPYNH